MPIVTPADVKQLQSDVRAESDALAQALKACIYASTIPAGDPLVAQWTGLMDRVQAFLAQEPSWLHTAAQMNAGEQLQRDLQPWHATLQQRGCANVPPAPSPPPAPGDLFGSLTNIGLILIVLMAMREMR